MFLYYLFDEVLNKKKSCFLDAAIINVRLVNVLISNQCHLRSKYQNWNGDQNCWAYLILAQKPRIIEVRV